MADRMLNTVQAAELLGVSVTTVKRLLYAGKIPYYRPSGARRVAIKESDLRAYLEQHRVEGGR